MKTITLGERKTRIIDEVAGSERLADVLSNSLGYSIIKKGGKYIFSLRPEKTPSVFVNNDGTVHDFGSGETFGFLSLVAMEFNIREADNGKQFLAEVEKAEEILKITNDKGCGYTFSSPRLSEDEKRRGEYITEPLEEEYISYFRQQGQKNITRVMELCRFLMPSANDNERTEMIKKFQIGFDPKRDRLTFPVRTMDGTCMNMFRYTSDPAVNAEGVKDPKILYLSKRERGFFNLAALKSCPETLYLLEGEKDVINATLSGTAAITQGSAGSWKKPMAAELKAYCDALGICPKIVIIQDHDMPGVVSSIRIYNDLAPLFKNIKMVFWKKSTANWIVKKLDKKVELQPNACRLSKIISESVIDPSHVCVIKNPPQEQQLVKGFDYTDYKLLHAS